MLGMRRCIEFWLNSMSLKRTTIMEGLGHSAIIAVPLTLFIVLGWLRLAPGGVFVVTANTLERSPYINRILPADRAPASTDGGSVTLMDDPTYFTALVPVGEYKSADVTIEYKNHEQPIIKLGVITDMVTNSFDLRALDNFIVDNIGWRESTVKFDITNLPRTNGTIKFILSTPGIKVAQHSVDIRRIKIAWHK